MLYMSTLIFKFSPVND